MSEDRIATVGIVGLGLIGGSVARDLAAAGVRILAHDADARTLDAARTAGAVSEPLDASLRGLGNADVVILAVPVTAAADLLAHIAACSPHALLMDVGSVKGPIEAAAIRCGVAQRFVGAHPLAGDERFGWDASRPGLFAGARVFLCPAPGARQASVRTARALWQRLGAVPEMTDAESHDRQLAWTSHLPQVLATGLALALRQAGLHAADLGTGGRGMTRLAASSPEMWSDIAHANRRHLRDAVAGVEGTLAELRLQLSVDGEAGQAGREGLHRFFTAGRVWAAGRAPIPEAHPAPIPDARAGGTVVAFQGELGAHSEECVRSFLPEPVEPLPCRTFQDVGRAVTEGTATYGLLPVENSTAGSIVAAYEVLARPGLAVLAEVVRPIRHALLGLPGAAVGRLRRVLSHPVALAQCSAFLDARRWIEGVAFYDTAGAAREVARTGDPALAAIAAEAAAARYGLEVLATDIQDRSDNRTRFVVMAAAHGSAREVPLRAGASRIKSALLLDVTNAPGALATALSPFATRGVNLTHIQSTPGDASWTYRFIIELDADVRSGHAADAIAELRGAGATVAVLGSYPAVEEH